MDDSKFLNVFSRLQSSDKTVLREAIQQLLGILYKAGDAGGTEERAYTLTRLTKGLASAVHEVKIGYSMALAALLRHFPDIDAIALYRSYKAFDQTISSVHSLRLGQVTLIACLFRGRANFTNKEVEQDMVELFQLKRETAEAISDVILISPHAKTIIGKVADPGDVNYLRLVYEGMNSDGSAAIQAVKAKMTILEGTLATLPRLHSVWTPILTSAYQSGKLSLIWKHFVETGIQTSDKNKKKVKFVSLGLALLTQVLIRTPLLLSDVLTPLFVKCWQEQCSHKNARLYSVANQVKEQMFSMLLGGWPDADVSGAVLALAKEVSHSEICIKLSEFVAAKAPPPIASSFSQAISESGNEQLISCVLHRMSKREEEFLRNTGTELMVQQMVALPGNLGLKAKLIDTLAGHSLKEVKSALQVWTENIGVDTRYRKVGKKALKRLGNLWKDREVEESVEKRKKRKRSSEGVYTDQQLQSLVKLAILRLVAGTHTPLPPPEDVLQLIDLAGHLQEAEPQHTSPTSEDQIFDHVFTCASDPILREPTKSTFREFVSELSDSSAEKLSSFLSAGHSSPQKGALPDPSEVLGEDVELTLDGELGSVLAQPKQLRAGSEGLEALALRASDLVEVVIKKSANQSHLILLGKSLLSGLREGSENTRNRYRALLHKFAKGNIVIDPESFEAYMSFLQLILGLNSRDGSMFPHTKATAVSLCKRLADHNPIDTFALLFQTLQETLEHHGSKVAFEQLKVLFGQVSKCVNSDLLEYLVKATIEPHSHFSQIQSLELLKTVAKKQTMSHTAIKGLIRYARTLLKKPMESKQSHADLKLLLSTLLAVCKKSEFVHRKLQRMCESATEKCKGLSGVMSVVGELKKHIRDVESKV